MAIMWNDFVAILGILSAKTVALRVKLSLYSTLQVKNWAGLFMSERGLTTL